MYHLLFSSQASYPTDDFLNGPDTLEGAYQLRVSPFQAEREKRRERVAQRNRNFKVRI